MCKNKYFLKKQTFKESRVCFFIEIFFGKKIKICYHFFMSKLYFVKILKSHYCQLVFFLGFIASYYLTPENVFQSDNRLIAIIFMFVFAMTITCVVRNIKEKVIIAKSLKSSLIGIIATAIGLSALQVCGMSGVCVAGAGVGVLSLILPGFMMNFLEDYSVILLYFSIFIQIVSLYYMKCFSLCKTYDLGIKDKQK